MQTGELFQRQHAHSAVKSFSVMVAAQLRATVGAINFKTDISDTQRMIPAAFTDSLIPYLVAKNEPSISKYLNIFKMDWHGMVVQSFMVPSEYIPTT